MAPTSRAHVIRIQVDDGGARTVDFNLNPGSRLLHVSVNTGENSPPVRVQISIVQPRIRAGFANTLLGGWIRGGGNAPDRTNDITWDGDILIGTDMALRMRARNDTGSSRSFAASIVVIQ